MAPPTRQKVHVDWKEYGICLYWMLGGADRCYSLARTGHCRWIHPPLSEVPRLWTDPAARLEYAARDPSDPTWTPPVQADPARAPLPLPPPPPHAVPSQGPVGAMAVPWSALPEPIGTGTTVGGSEVRLETRGAEEAGEAKLLPQAEATFEGTPQRPPPPPQGTVVAYKRRSPHPPSIPPPPPRPRAAEAAAPSPMAGIKRLSNGEAKPPIGPHPSTIRVANPYTTEASIEKRLYPPGLEQHERSLAEAKEDAFRLQGVMWIDNVRRALQLPIKTFTTACCLYHKFRLQHPGADYPFADAAAASLLAACKIEDTLKKSKDILAASCNLRLSPHEALSPDDPVFESAARAVIGLERLVLEAASFDFRSVRKHEVLVKCAKMELKQCDPKEARDLGNVAWTVLTDLHRTFASLKHTTATQAIACLELALHLQPEASTATIRAKDQPTFDYAKWSTKREDVMETLLDLLDLYTHHATSTILGTKYILNDFLQIRLVLNKECEKNNIPRFQARPVSAASHPSVNGATLRVANGHATPVSPSDDPANAAQPIGQPIVTGVPPVPEGGGTLRFVLNPQRAAEEKTEVQKYFTEEWEEYDEEIEVPMPRPPKPASTRSASRDRDSRPHPPVAASRGSSRDQSIDRGPPTRPPHSGPLRPPQPRDPRDLDTRRPRDDLRDRHREYDRRGDIDDYGPPPRGLDSRRPPRDDPRDRARDRDRDRERVQHRARERDFRRPDNRRFDDRRYDDRFERRDRRYDYDDRRSRR